MKVFSLLFMAGFLSFTNFMCSGKSEYQDFSSDTSSYNYVRQRLADTLSPLKSASFCDNVLSLRKIKDSRDPDGIFNAVKFSSLSH
jgi:hypothetical protein